MDMLGLMRRKSRHVKIETGSDNQSLSSIKSSGSSINADLSYEIGRHADLFSLGKLKEKNFDSKLDWYFKDLANQPIEMSPQALGGRISHRGYQNQSSQIKNQKTKSMDREQVNKIIDRYFKKRN